VNDDITLQQELNEPAPSFNRRRFLMGAGAAAAGAVVVVGALGRDDGARQIRTGAVAGARPAPLPAPSEGDARTAAFAAGLEALAVGTYKAALDAATANKLGAVPPAGAEFVKVALAQHQEHQNAWNKILTDAGQSAVTEPDAGLKPTIDQKFSEVTDFAGAARLALLLEETAAATYLKAIPTLDRPDAAKLAASIQAVDAKHAAVLHFVLGEYPVPDVFAKTALAASPSASATEGPGLPRTS
jgi:hypothetical protein